MRVPLAFPLAVLGAIFAGGCATAGRRSNLPASARTVQRPQAEFVPGNYTADPALPAGLRRVVLLPVHGGEFAPPEAVESLDPVMATELERQLRFEVVTFPREECLKLYGVPDLSSAAALPPDFLATLERKYGAQGVMFVDITSYQPYRPLTLGLRAKLALIADHRLAWSVDEVFSTNDPAAVLALRRYYQHNELGNLPFDLTPDDLQSPTRFAAFAADMAFRTLPPR